MIKINLLGHKEVKKEPLKSERKGGSIVKTVFYVIILIIAIGLGIYTYFPGLLKYIPVKTKPQVSIQEPSKIEVPETKAPIKDTTQQALVQKETIPPIEQKPKEEIKPEPKTEVQKPKETVIPKEEISKPKEEIPKPKTEVQKPKEEIPKPKEEAPKPVAGEYLTNAYLINQRELSGFSALREAVSGNMNYSLITVNNGQFISEILVGTKDEIAQYNINVKNKLPESGIKIIGINETTETKKLKAQIWGYLDSYKMQKEKTEISLKNYYKPSEVISKIRSIAKKSGFIIKSFVIQNSFEQDNYQKFPVLIRIGGNDGNTVDFLKNLKKENLNFIIQKISGVPDNKEILIAIIFEVFVPSA